MDFRFTEEQIMFRDVVRDFLERECTPKTVRAIQDSLDGAAPVLRAGIADLGLTGLALPEAYGGLGLGEIDAVLVAEECGRAALPGALFENAAVAGPLLAAVGGAVATQWLPQVAAGKATLAIGHEINPYVADAGSADILLMAEKDGLYALPRGCAGLSDAPSVDRGRRLSRVAWMPTPELRISEGPAVREQQSLAFDRAALYTAADMLGAAQRMLDMAVEYAGQREQFGRPIGSFQAIKHSLADVQVRLTFARPVVYYAAYALAYRLPDRAVRVSHAKVAAAEAALLAARRTFQAHGAIGYTWEYDLQIWMKRVWANEACWGTSAWHRARIAKEILGPDAALGAGSTWAA